MKIILVFTPPLIYLPTSIVKPVVKDIVGWDFRGNKGVKEIPRRDVGREIMDDFPLVNYLGTRDLGAIIGNKTGCQGKTPMETFLENLPLVK
jgi:hypothetical protein